MNGKSRGISAKSISMAKTTAGVKPSSNPDFKNVTWPKIKAGDIIDLVAPGFGPTPKEIRGAVKFLREWGLNPRVPVDLLGPDILCSNSDEMRFKFLRKALFAKDSKAIWCLRGGYGANRLLPYLQRLKPPASNKVLIGYSDVTTVHLFLNQQWGWNTIHGPLLDRFGAGAGRSKDKKELKQCLFGERDFLKFTELRPLNQRAQASGIVRGRLTGGNLTTWTSAIGTAWAGKPQGKILFFEDIGEQGRKVDRMLVQLEQSGGFKGLKALIFGEFVGGAQPNGRYVWPDVLRRFADEAPFPVFDHFPAGHGQSQRPVPFGPMAVLKKGRHPELTVKVGNQG